MQLDPARIGSFIEVHIEQGPVLIEAGLPVGIVTGIAGGFRHTHAVARGTWAHSGAAPRRHRQDAALGLYELIRLSESAWDAIEASGKAATITFGRIATDPALHSGSRVPGEITFCLDVRSEHEDVLDDVRRSLELFREEVRRLRGVGIDLGPELTWRSAAMAPRLIEGMEAAARRAGVPAMRMPSGAGHDTAVFAEAGVPSVMLFVRNANGSHNPDEAMDAADLDCAVRVVLEFLGE
jgi:N-carbamoyl-L-amino-acid hydrolase